MQRFIKSLLTLARRPERVKSVHATDINKHVSRYSRLPGMDHIGVYTPWCLWGDGEGNVMLRGVFKELTTSRETAIE